MKIWIDLANSPHVLFFQPIINKLNEENHEIIFSLRDFCQTVELAKKIGIEGTIIGKHSGKGILKKSWSILNRTIKLWRFYKGEKIDLAISHNSYSQIVAGRLLGIRTVTIMDYEGQPANHLAFRLANKILVPEYFPDESLKKSGANYNKVFKYKGFKEQLYLNNCSVNDKFINELKTTCNLDADWNILKTTLITIRPPGLTAVYHRFENPLFNKLLNLLKKTEGITVLLIPRTQEQENEIKNKYTFIKIPQKPLDGFNLLNVSDIVISAGGTMNREAAILGIPAYTIFAGSLPAVDQKLIEIGRMKSILSIDDFRKIKIEKKKGLNILKNENLLNEIYQQIFIK